MTGPGTGVSWERVAHVLERESVCDVELAARLTCPPGFVARVRHDLGMPSFPIPVPETRIARPVTEADRKLFEEQSVVTADGHRVWLGRRNVDGTPIFATGVTAYRLAFRLQYGEEPEGHTRVECVVQQCVEGLHLSDRLMRERARGVTS